MNHRSILAVVLAALVLGAACAGAEDPLSREEARGLAVSHSATLQRKLLSVDSALLTEKAQSYSFLPAVSANVGTGISYPKSSLADVLGGSVGLTVTQAIYDGGKSALLSAIDALDTRLAREEARSEYFSVLQATDSAFSSVIDAQSSLEAAASDLQAAQTHLGLAQARLEAGIITRTELLKAESEAAASETSMTTAQGKLSVAYARLASLTGLSLPLELDTEEEAGVTDLMGKLAAFAESQTAALITSAVEAASANNPSLAQAGLSQQRAQGGLDLARADYLPSVSASWTNGLAYSSGLGSGNGTLTVSVSIPLDFWVTKTAVDSKAVGVRQASLDAGETRRNLDLEVRSAVYDLVSSARAVVSAAKALQYAESHYQGVLAQFRLSAASSSDLSDAESLVSSARTQLIGARSGFRSSLTALRTLAGLESDELLVRMVL